MCIYNLVAPGAPVGLDSELDKDSPVLTDRIGSDRITE